MRRRKFLFTLLFLALAPKSLLTNYKIGHNLLVKNGWILKTKDI